MKPELILPAGSLEKLRYAIAYGADAVYLGVADYGLREPAALSWSQLAEAIQYAHSQGVKVYLTLNAFPHPEALRRLEQDLPNLKACAPDALIVADPGVLSVVRSLGIPLHLSTQANTVNAKAARFWYEAGVRRIVLARELSLAEIASIHQEVPELELEAFVHGAMCMAYSGRCLISNFLAHRDANRGSCAQACRWNYRLLEEKRPGEYFPIEEDARGSYVMSSRDLCMIRHLPALRDAGVLHFKVEGRTKSAYYVAMVARAYRAAIERLADSSYEVEDLVAELESAPHRGYTTGFYFGAPGPEDHAYDEAGSRRPTEFLGRVVGWNENVATVEVRNYFTETSRLEVMTPDATYSLSDLWIRSPEGEVLSRAHPGQTVQIPAPPLGEWAIIRSTQCVC